MPSDVQDTTIGQPFDSKRENLERTIKQYRNQMDYMQEVNDGVILENKILREDLQRSKWPLSRACCYVQRGLEEKKNHRFAMYRAEADSQRLAAVKWRAQKKGSWYGRWIEESQEESPSFGWDSLANWSYEGPLS